MASADIDELLGPKPRPKIKYKQPRKTKENNANPDDAALGHNKVSLDLRDVAAGVSISWLKEVFRMHPMTVKKRLANCPTLGQRRGGQPVFDLAQAASYLVKPRIDVEAYLKGMRPSDLPVHLQSEYWSAKISRQKWEEAAGHLWRTEAVLEVFGETFKLFKEVTMLWVDDLDRNAGLTDEQRAKLTQMIDGLLDQLHEKLVEMPRRKQTRSMLAEHEDESQPVEIGEEDLVG